MRLLGRRLTAALSMLLVVCFLVFPASSHAAASPDPLSESEAISLLREYSIVLGDPSGNLMLDDRVTRAQAAALFVRSMGASESAKMLGNLVPFTDAQGHWAAGEITMASRLGLMNGDGNGTFRPESEITYAEMLTVLLRIVKQEPAGPWNRDLIMATAAQIGFAPQGAAATDLAIRRRIFWSLANALARVPLPTGKTALQTYVDTTPPELTLTQAAITTQESRVSLSGTATGATQVTVQGKAATLTANGQFLYTIDVAVGTNRLTVEAADRAGNTTEATVVVERRATASSLKVEGPALVKAGTSTKLTITAYDSQNREVQVDNLESTMTGGVATFDEATRTLKAGSQIGRGVLTLTAGSARTTFTFDVKAPSDNAASLKISDVNGGHAPVPGKDATVKVQVLDDTGKVATTDYFRNVTLSASGISGLSITPATAATVAGVATFIIKGTTEDTGILTATSSGLDSASANLQILKAPRVVLVATPTTLKPDGTSTATIRAQLENEIGSIIRNDTSSNIEIDLTNATSEGTLNNDTLVIVRGSSSSSSSVTYQAGIKATTAEITGTVTSSQKYPVQTLKIPVQGDLTGARLIITGPTANQPPNGTGAVLTVKVVNAAGTTITTGSYAFQLAVTTSNNDPVVNGLPEGVDLVMNGTTYRPVSTTSTGGDYVVGRTYQGSAAVKLTYTKSGTVTVTPKAVPGTLDGYHNTQGFGPAASSEQATVTPFKVNFAGTPARIQLTADSVLGTDLPGAAVASARQVIIRARVLDASGAPVPGNRSEITLTRSTAGDGVTRLSGTSSTTQKKTVVDGEPEFTITTTATPGFDVYTATSGTLQSASLTVAVRDSQVKADVPIIAAIRGVKEGDTAPVNGYIAPDDDYMEIQLEPQSPPNSGEPTNWVTAKVYRKGETTAIVTGAALDLNAFAPVIRIPKAKLIKYGSYCYQVTLNNASGDTARSVETPACVAANATYSTTFKLASAQFDAETGKLTLATSGLTTTGIVDPARLTIVSDDATLSLNNSAVSVVSVSSSAVVLQLGDVAAELTPDLYHGTVYVKAQDGWYTSSDGSQIAKAFTSSVLKPMGYITNATLDIGAKRLYINGVGFKQGTPALGLVEVGNGTDVVALRPGTTSTTDQTLTTSTDTQIILSLSTQTLDAIRNLTGPNLVITAGVGWLKTGSGTSTYKNGAVSARPVYVQVTVNTAPYTPATNTLTINGSGFMGATLDPTKLHFKYSRMTGSDWRPTGSATVTVVSDTKITVEFSDTEAAAFETKFANRNVYLNTDPGWLTDQNGRQASALGINTVWFYVGP
jgi:hypothetical protein